MAILEKPTNAIGLGLAIEIRTKIRSNVVFVKCKDWLKERTIGR